MQCGDADRTRVLWVLEEFKNATFLRSWGCVYIYGDGVLYSMSNCVSPLVLLFVGVVAIVSQRAGKSLHTNRAYKKNSVNLITSVR